MSQGGPPPVSYKTNVNRSKTKRWVEAKHYTYDGDEWGDADEYDEYGGYDEPAAQQPTGLRQSGQSTQAPEPSRGQPAPGGPQPPYARPQQERQGSFGRGDDRQSLGWPPSGVPGAPSPGSHSPIISPIRTAYGQQPPTEQNPHSRGSTPGSSRAPPQGAPRSASDYRQSPDPHNRPNIISPTAVHPPFNTQQQRPSSSSSSTAQAAAPRERSDSSGKAMPFIRPADIYKRMQEEKEKHRASQESSRTSLDAAQAEKTGAREPSPGKSGDESGGARQAPLGTVAERKSEYGSDGLLSPTKLEALKQNRRESGSPQLPEIGGFGTDFANDFGSWGSSPPKAASASKPEPPPQQPEPALESQQKEPGPLQKAPSQGFRSAVEQAFDQPAVPETPSSASGSQVARSNSESTTAISPIISRGPSDAQPHQKSIDTEVRDAQFPPIAEEPNTPVQSLDERGRSSTVDDKPPGFIPGYRRETGAPSPDNSPARKAAVAAARGLRQPQEAKLASTTQHSGSSESTAEDDVAATATAPAPPAAPQAQPAVAAAQSPRTSQPSSRTESPTKGRVRDMAEKIDSGPNSRRGSQDSARAESPTKSAQRPQSGRLESFRPSVPGGWNSYTTNTPPGPEAASEPAKPQDGSTKTAAVFGATAAVAAATAAAAATAEKPRSAGSGHIASQFQAPETSKEAPAETPSPQSWPTLGLQPSQTESSSIMHTPQGMADGHDLSKDASYFDKISPLNTKQHSETNSQPAAATSTPARVPNMSTDSSPTDQESDRLRKQLVRELSPTHETAPPLDSRLAKVQTDASLASGGDTNSRQDSSVVPSEYDRYWTKSSYASTNAGPTDLDTNARGPITDHPDLNESPTAADPPAAAAAEAAQNHKANVRDAPIQQESGQRRFSWEHASELYGNEPDDQEVVNSPTAWPSDTPTAWPGAFESHQADDLAKALYTPPPSGGAPLSGQKDLPMHSLFSPEDLNLLNSPTDADFMAVNDPLHGSPKFGQTAGGPIGSSQRTPAFREVQALQTPEERLRVYALARSNLAKEDSGLLRFLVTSGPTGSQPTFSPKADVATGRPAQARQSPGPAGPAPTNASVSNLGTSTPNLGGSPSSGKLSSVQMKSKGKDVLHSAGVFSGKANVAAKGLLAKGRSKLRNAGGDKASQKGPPPAASAEFAPRERHPFKFASFSASSLTHRNNNSDHSGPSLTSPPPERSRDFSPSPVSPRSPAVGESTRPQPHTFPKRHAHVPMGIYLGASPVSSPTAGTSPSPARTIPSPMADGPLSPIAGALPSPLTGMMPSPTGDFPPSVSISSLGREDVSKTSSRPSSLSASKQAHNNEQPKELAPSSPLAPPPEAKPSSIASSHQEPIGNEDAESVKVAPTPSVEEEAEPEKPAPLNVAPKNIKAEIAEAEKLEPATPLGETERPKSGSPVHESPMESKGDATPTQENFPPSAPKITTDLVEKNEDASSSQLPIIPTGGPQPPSQRSSLALGDIESKQFVLQTPMPDPDFTLMPIFNFDELEKPPEPAPPTHVAVPSAVPIAAEQPRTISLAPEPPAPPKGKGHLSMAMSRPFSFIDFDSNEPKDLALNFQLPPSREEPEEPEEPENPVRDRTESLASVDEEAEGGILADKEIEAAQPGTPASRPRSGAHPFEEPDIGNHPAFKTDNETRRSSRHEPLSRSPEPMSPAPPSPRPQESRSASAMGNAHPNVLQPPQSPLRPSLLSRPSRDTNHSGPVEEKKKKKRTSLFSSLSATSGQSKRRSTNLDASSLPIDTQPDVYSYPPSAPFQSSAFRQRKLSIGSDEAEKGPQRSLSRQLLQRLPGPLGKTPESSEPRPEKEKPEKGKKRRFSGLGGFISRTVRPRQNSHSGPPPVNTFAHIRSTSQASYYDQSLPTYQPKPGAYGAPASLHQRQQSYATQLSLGHTSNRSGSASSLNRPETGTSIQRPDTSNSQRKPIYSPFPHQRSTPKGQMPILPPQANLIASDESYASSSPPRHKSPRQGENESPKERVSMSIARALPSSLMTPSRGHQRNGSAPERNLPSGLRNHAGRLAPDDAARNQRSGSMPRSLGDTGRRLRTDSLPRDAVEQASRSQRSDSATRVAGSRQQSRRRDDALPSVPADAASTKQRTGSSRDPNSGPKRDGSVPRSSADPGPGPTASSKRNGSATRSSVDRATSRPRNVAAPVDRDTSRSRNGSVPRASADHIASQRRQSSVPRSSSGLERGSSTRRNGSVPRSSSGVERGTSARRNGSVPRSSVDRPSSKRSGSASRRNDENAAAGKRTTATAQAQADPRAGAGLDAHPVAAANAGKDDVWEQSKRNRSIPYDAATSRAESPAASFPSRNGATTTHTMTTTTTTTTVIRPRQPPIDSDARSRATSAADDITAALSLAAAYPGGSDAAQGRKSSKAAHRTSASHESKRASTRRKSNSQTARSSESPARSVKKPASAADSPVASLRKAGSRADSPAESPKKAPSGRNPATTKDLPPLQTQNISVAPARPRSRRAGHQEGDAAELAAGGGPSRNGSKGEPPARVASKDGRPSRAASTKESVSRTASKRSAAAAPPAATDPAADPAQHTAAESAGGATPESARAAKQKAIEASGWDERGRAGAGKEVVAGNGGGNGGAGKGVVVDGEVIPMSSTAYPGQEWRPDWAWDGT